MDRRCLVKPVISILMGVLFLNSNCKLYYQSFPNNDPKNKSSLSELSFILPDGKYLPKTFWNEGKSVLYFGFSHCPDMCPLALTNFSKTALILGPKAKDFRFIFVTLDPERDDPLLLSKYVNQFQGGKLIALSPSSESLGKVEGLFGITNRKVATGNTYSIDHSNFIFVLDHKLQQIAVYPGGTSPVTLANSLRVLN
ncbi:MAG: SCO family protein [Leptospira sp.]|nr:SCO family protein [Leptospira sp.]